MRRGVEPEMVEVAVDEPPGDRSRHDVARREVGERVLVGHERHAVLVTEHRALTAQRLREQRPGHRRVVERGRVELHELDVGHRARRPAAPSAMPSPVETTGFVVTAKSWPAPPVATIVSARPDLDRRVRRDRARARRRTGRPRRSGRPRSSALAPRRDPAPGPRRRARARSRRRSRRRPRARPARRSGRLRGRARGPRSRRRRCGRTPRRAPSGRARGPGPR